MRLLLIEDEEKVSRFIVKVWIPKMPSESFRPEFHQIDEFNFDSAYVKHRTAPPDPRLRRWR